MNNTITELSYFEQVSINQSNRDFWLNIVIAIITFLSVALVYIDYRNRKNKERAEKSINLAEEFAQSIIPKISILFSHYETIGLMSIVNKVKFIEFTDFDFDELNELYSSEDIKIYEKILSDNTIFKINDQDIDITNFITSILNELEHMCMYITTKVADEKYIYNSLHQQFFKAISTVYFSICDTNIDNKDKYYTNIIEVFNIWKNKYLKATKREKQIKKKLKPQNPKV